MAAALARVSLDLSRVGKGTISCPFANFAFVCWFPWSPPLFLRPSPRSRAAMALNVCIQTNPLQCFIFLAGTSPRGRGRARRCPPP